ncbi:prohibitin family protein [Acuticoccus kandeliae]|uniref:prohibitin family protein n=1 Tax=Acuticoccus kandeliae TaxID=2073160 RepID=UPI000D3ED544|nr:prohibitin family protein [Acuticoccus kandeliae]
MKAATTMTAKQPAKRHRWLDATIIFSLFVGVSLIFLWQTLFVLVPPGSAGVIYRVFLGGTDLSLTLREGINYKWPWNSVYLYEMRTQENDITVIAQSTDGLVIEVDLSVLYHPNEEHLPQLHVGLGPDYYERKVRPIIMESTRQVIGKYDTHALYSRDTRAVSLEIRSSAAEQIAPHNIELVDVLIRRLVLPPEVNAAIARKLVEEQAVQTHEFRLQLERIEAERKRIEAVGIRQFYDEVAEALTPPLLTWRGIEATVRIAQSQNSKIVIVGGGQDQMPLILGSDLSNLPPPPPGAGKDDPQTAPDGDTLPSLFPQPFEEPSSTTGEPYTSDPLPESPAAFGGVPQDSDGGTTSTPASPAPAAPSDTQSAPGGSGNGSGSGSGTTQPAMGGTTNGNR